MYHSGLVLRKYAGVDLMQYTSRMIDAEKVLGVVRETRAISLPKWGNIEATSKSDLASDLVTEIDNRIEEYLKEKLAALYPDIAFVGEETGGGRESETFWLCDPIDGTVHYVRGTALCTTMVCLIEKGEVVFSCIYHFVTDDMYHAVRGGGAFKNGKPISVSARPLKGAYIGYERNAEPDGAWDFRRPIMEKNCATVHTINCGWEFSMVAEGKLDARVQYNPWGDIYDFAPGSLLVSEAGGIVRNIGSDSYDYKNLSFIAANPVIYEELKEIITENRGADVSK